MSLQMLLLTSLVFTLSGALKVTGPDAAATLIISNAKMQGCRVCRDWAEPSQQCGYSLSLHPNTNTSSSLGFDCPKPHDVFEVEIFHNIECSTNSCNAHILQSDSSFLPLLGFNRTFTWNLKASEQTAFKIDFTKTGLRQIPPSEVCPDGHSYTLRAVQATGNVSIGKYCRVGIITSAQILNSGSFSVDVPGGQKLTNVRFDVSVGEEIHSTAKITLTFPKGTSSSELLSPNYPDSFPSNDVIEWYFQVPDKHRTSVQFLNLTQPQCLRNQTAVEYHSKGRAVSVQSLTEPKPNLNWGNGSLTLRNCDMDRRRSSYSGLSVNLRVSTSSPVSCQVNTSDFEGLTLIIEKLKPTSDCVMKINSVMKDKITVVSSGELSFQDCLPDDVQVTAARVIECRQLIDCPKAPVSLLVPMLPSCLPAPLTSVTWIFRTPHDGTVELASPDGPLKQSLPGQICNDSILIKLSEGGSPIGDFCPQGAIEKVQIHSNLSVTMSSTGGKDVRTSYKYVLNACFKEEISERYIFTVTTKKDTPVLLATPGWPAGMRGYSTVSWIVSVAPNLDARVVFANLTQPKCNNYHTDISVHRIGRPALDYSRRDDEKAESELTVSDSFYLNMSSCKIEKGRFSVLTEITTQVPKRTTLLAIILSAVAAVAVLFVIAVAVACVVVQKRKKSTHQTSVYNPNGTATMLGHRGPEGDNGAHVYATIDETLIYSHLLTSSSQFSIYRDTNQTVADTKAALTSEDADAEEVEVGVYHPFQAPPLPDRPRSQPLVDNEIYHTESTESRRRHPVNLGPRLEPEGGN